MPLSGVAEFIGRDRDLDQIHQLFQDGNPAQISAISGMGGIGKSELALQYAYRHVRSTYPGGVVWLKAREDIGLQILSWARLYADLVPPEDYEIAKQIQWCWRRWQNAATLGVIAAFELSWQELTPQTQAVTARLSLFALAEIPWQLVADCCSELDAEELEQLRDDELCRASLLTRTGQGMYELHQLLREFFALKLAEIPQREKFTTEFAQVLTTVAKTIFSIVTLEQQTNLIEFIPHLSAATEFAQNLERRDKIWCCTGLGRFYQAQNQFKVAESWHQKSLDISISQLGLSDPSTAASLNNLAELYRFMGRYNEAKLLYTESLAIFEQQIEVDYLEVSPVMNRLVAL